MWTLKHPINIVTTAGSWFEIHAESLMQSLKRLKFNCTVKTSHENVEADSIAIYLSYQRIVPVSFIKATHQSLVVHASDLPKGKGFSPWVWQILEGKNFIPVCLFQMVEGLDEGDIFQKKLLHFDGTELIDEIREKLATLINEMVIEYLTADKKPEEGIKQIGESTFYRKRNAADSELNPNKSIVEQFDLLRVVDNEKYPAFFHYKNKKYFLKIERIND